jgi:hypothetical protein
MSLQIESPPTSLKAYVAGSDQAPLVEIAADEASFVTATDREPASKVPVVARELLVAGTKARRASQGEIAEVESEASGFPWHMVAAREGRRVADRLPLTGIAVAGAVIGHTLAYVVAVPQPGARLALLATTGHSYWSTAIAVAMVCGLASVASSLIRQFRAGLLAARRPPERSLGRLAARLALLQVTIYLVQELIERAAAGVPVVSPVDGRLLLAGVAVQLLVAAVLAVVLTWAGRVAEVAGRALRRRRRRHQLDLRPAHLRPTGWVRPAILLAAGLGGRAPPPTRAR